MKIILLGILSSYFSPAFAQANIPFFLEGTWKMENEEVYEHWDKVNEHTLKGFSYALKNGKMEVSEYIEISKSRNKIIYTATVLKQNAGEGIAFKLTKVDSAFTFENLKHDFPKRVVYQKLTEKEIFVKVSDTGKSGFSYKMQKQNAENPPKDTLSKNPNYDPNLAQKLGGNDYGMKSYVLVVLKTGANPTKDQALISQSFKGHMENIHKLVKEGKMIVAGPLGKNEKAYRGIFILNVTTFEEAKPLLEQDAAIKEGILDYELYQWHGSAALPEYLQVADKIWKSKP